MTRFSILAAVGVSALAMASAAQAADLIISEPMVGVVESTGNWDGMFIGVFGGYGWGSTTDEFGASIDVSGWLVGVDAGANFYLSDGIVAGVVGDIAWSNMGGESASGILYDVDWVGSLRGRLGFDGGAFMPYLTGGLAVAATSVDATALLGGITDSATHIGWTVGAGVEIAATEELSIDLLYRYSDYGSQTYEIDGTGPFEADLVTHQVTAGLHWNF